MHGVDIQRPTDQWPGGKTHGRAEAGEGSNPHPICDDVDTLDQYVIHA
jgi:hypothetical protein